MVKVPSGGDINNDGPPRSPGPLAAAQSARRLTCHWLQGSDRFIGSNQTFQFYLPLGEDVRSVVSDFRLCIYFYFCNTMYVDSLI